MKPSVKNIFSGERFIIFALLTILAVFFCGLAYLSAGVYGGADTYLHYAISHYAFAHPSLFLNHWGKPLFTLLSSVFSQAGFAGMQAFNILISLLSAFLAYSVCKMLGLRYAWLSIILLCFAPVYFILVFSGLTETLFGLVLISGAFYFLRKNYAVAAIIISFLPFARTEGFAILPLFALAFAFKRKWLALGLLATGFVAYGVVGYFVNHDFWWFFTQNPYQGAQDIYGKGSLWHFVGAYREIFGPVLTLLVLIGLAAYALPFFSRKRQQPLPVSEIFVVMLPAALYFAAHSYVWWRGLNGSLGLVRVMAGILPLAAVLGIKGLNLLAPAIGRYKKLFVGLGLALVVYIVYQPFATYPLPFPNGPEERVLDKTALWLQKNQLNQQKIYTINAYLFFKLSRDPFDTNLVAQSYPPAQNLTAYTQPGDLLIWDSHFGPNEGRLDLETLLANPYFVLNALFLGDDNYVALGGRPYEVYVFQRTVDTNHLDNHSQLLQLKENYYVKKPIYVNTFSHTHVFADSAQTNSCFLITPPMEFSPGLDTVLADLHLPPQSSFEMCVDLFGAPNLQNTSIDMVASVFSGSKSYLYTSFPIRLNQLTPNTWNTLHYTFAMPQNTQSNAQFKVYLWNNNKAKLFIDNLNVSMIVLKQQ
ncbi:MAG: hypothetical protein WCQ95_04775 [Bacteroidota bacterium]